MLNTPNPLADLLRRSFYKMVQGFIVHISTLLGQIANIAFCRYLPKQNLNGYDSVWAGGAGKNLANINSVADSTTVSVSVSGNTITCTSKNTGSNRYTRCFVPNSLLGKTVTLSVKISASSTNTPAVRMYFMASSSANTSISSGVTGTGSKEITITIPDTFPVGCDGIALLLYAVTSGTTGSGLSASFENLQLEIGSSSTPYAPYSNICDFTKVSTDTLTVEGKNAFSFNAGANIAGGGGSMSYVKTPNTVNMVATGTSGAQYYGVRLSRRFDKTKTYTLSFKSRKIVKGTDGNPLIQCVIYGANEYGSTYTTISRLNVLNANITPGVVYSLSGQFTGYPYYRFYFYNNSNTPVSVGENTEYFDIQFEEGETATTFEEYRAKSYTSAISPAIYAGSLAFQSGYVINNYSLLETTWSTGTSSTVLGNCERRSFNSQISNVDLDNRGVALCNCAPYLAGWATDSNHFYITSAGGLAIFLPVGTPEDQVIKVIYPTTTSTFQSTTKHHVEIPKGESFVYSKYGDEVIVKYKEK